LFGVLILLIPVPIVLVVLGLMVVDRVRRSEHGALVLALAAAAERGVPLPEAARAFADEMQADTGVRSLVVAQNLERGLPLWEAARASRLRMGTAMRLTIRLGETLGMLGPAMRQQLTDSQLADEALRAALGRFFYLGNVVVILWGIGTFVMLKIVPVFERMFAEFELKLPAMTVLVINLSNWIVKIGWVVLMPFFLLLPIFLMASLLYYVGFFPRGLPLVWWLTRRYDGAVVMRGLALAIRRGLPLPAALHLVSESYPVSLVVGRLRFATLQIAAGSNWIDALLQTRLIASADAAVLAAAERTGNLPWALEQMADSAIRRQTQRVQVLLQLTFPLALLLVAGVVGIFVIGLFLPLVSLIQGLA
jgi:type II secretory pathway component PulF